MKNNIYGSYNETFEITTLDLSDLGKQKYLDQGGNINDTKTIIGIVQTPADLEYKKNNNNKISNIKTEIINLINSLIGERLDRISNPKGNLNEPTIRDLIIPVLNQYGVNYNKFKRILRKHNLIIHHVDWQHFKNSSLNDIVIMSAEDHNSLNGSKVKLAIQQQIFSIFNKYNIDYITAYKLLKYAQLTRSMGRTLIEPKVKIKLPYILDSDERYDKLSKELTDTLQKIGKDELVGKSVFSIEEIISKIKNNELTESNQKLGVFVKNKFILNEDINYDINENFLTEIWGDIDIDISRNGITVYMPDSDDFDRDFLEDMNMTKADVMYQLNQIYHLIVSCKFYDVGYNRFMLELSDKPVLNYITADISNEDYVNLAQELSDEFEIETGVDLYHEGRMNRHACVKLNIDNLLNYHKLVDTYRKYEDELIDEANNFENDIDESLENEAKFKLRIYELSGLNKGNLDHEEFFMTKEEAVNRYRELFDRRLFSLNPTMWEKHDNDWVRLRGF